VSIKKFFVLCQILAEVSRQPDRRIMSQQLCTDVHKLGVLLYKRRLTACSRFYFHESGYFYLAKLQIAY
jgi:hypothetical protein